MSKEKGQKLLEVERWAVGCDPGFSGTALTLLADDDPLASELAKNESTKHVSQRTRRLKLWLIEVLQGWIDTYEIPVLHFMIEQAFLNDKTRSVKTLASQMRMYGVYQDALFDLERCEVWVGEVNNQTAKKVFTGMGNATKIQMIDRSVWSHRSDIDTDKFRQHLADSQGIGTCYPKMVKVDSLAIAMLPTYEDHNIGKGSAWRGRYKRKT